MRRTGLFLWVALGLGGAPASAQAKPQLTAAQVEAGKAVFAANCAPCHNADLSGTAIAPPLVGESFANDWGRQTAAKLFEFVSTEMPQSAPGTLDRDSYIRAMAYILSLNGVPTGATELTPTDPGVIGAVSK